MPVWSEGYLQTCAIDGVEFPVSSFTRTGGRAVARHVYPYRDGQDTEDLGRQPLKWSINVPLFEGIDPSLYPDTYEALRFVLDAPDTQGDVEFVDPELGPLPAKIVSHTWTLDPMKRNGGNMKIELEERSSLPFIVRQADEAFDAQSNAEDEAAFVDDSIEIVEDDIIDAWSNGGVPLTEIPRPASGTLFTSLVDDFFDRIETARLSADEIAAEVDTFRARMDVVIQSESYEQAESWNVVQSIGRLQQSITLAGDRAAKDAPRIYTFTLPSPMSVFELSVLLYTDASRAPEILQRNPQPRPLVIPRGTTVRVLNR